ncbi:hypothetical protein [Pendulispora albinea]|uniref:Uncharacterized protein n=1 Tax=Pendulispora albinea TaxID=2741071 RepID=A0ABZ2LW21_9BACT
MNRFVHMKTEIQFGPAGSVAHSIDRDPAVMNPMPVAPDSFAAIVLYLGGGDATGSTNDLRIDNVTVVQE